MNGEVGNGGRGGREGRKEDEGGREAEGRGRRHEHGLHLRVPLAPRPRSLRIYECHVGMSRWALLRALWRGKRGRGREGRMETERRVGRQGT